MTHARLLSDARLRAELTRCESCEEKPCREGCPAHCSPADFILAARVGEASDLRRAAMEIMMANPLGGVCGLVCPDTLCMAACSHKLFDGAIRIPAVQATVVAKAKALGGIPVPPPPTPNGRRVAVVGAGPAGLGAAGMLARQGYAVEVFDEQDRMGGALNLIPSHRLPRDVVESDIAWLLTTGDIRFTGDTRVDDPAALLDRGFDGVVVAGGLTVPMKLNIPGEEAHAWAGLPFLAHPERYPITGHVVVVGGGATAVDCAVTAKLHGAPSVEMVCLERGDEMPLTADERREIAEHGVEVTGRTSLVSIAPGRVETRRMVLPPGTPFRPAAMQPATGGGTVRDDIAHVIVAIGARRSTPAPTHPRVVAAGDMRTGPSTVVGCSASGKNAAMQLHAVLTGAEVPTFQPHNKSRVPLPGAVKEPVSLETDFFGRTLRSPFLLSAAPPTDGYEQVRRAYEAGWAGAVFKTAFDGVPIHIPGEYMHVFNAETYGNSDNVSGHPLRRVCAEIRRLVEEYPDCLTVGSTGGPVTGNDERDRAGWLHNTALLEEAGAMAIEYSLSCPQGGDGTEGDIVSQNPRLTAKIIEWILAGSTPSVPKLFKLTAAVTSIDVILRAILEVFARYPDHKAGVTLANTFPVVSMRRGRKDAWEEGIIVGMSGAGVAPISNLTLTRAGATGIYVSGNGGPMDYKAAAHFLALGAGTVQFCTIAMKYGYGIVDDLHAGLSFLMQARGIRSVAELRGRAWPHPVTDFMALTPVKKISQVNADLCLHCGNCTRCPYLAIHLDEAGIPSTDPSRCVGCSICAQKCFAGALFMRERTPAELEALKED